jgi:hypothetical protein
LVRETLRERNAQEALGRDILNGIGFSEVLATPLSNDESRAAGFQASSQNSYKAQLAEIKASLNAVAKELKIVKNDLNQQARYVAPFNKLGSAITSLNTQLAAQSNAAAKAKIQKELAADQAAQNKILAQDTTVYNATGAEEDTIDAQENGIDSALANLPPLMVALGGSVTSVPKTAAPRKKTTFVITVTSTGNISASGSLAIVLGARPAGSDGDSDIVLPSASVKIKIKPGTSAKEKVSVVIPDTLPAGNYTLVAQLDPHNTFHEAALPGLIVGTQIFAVS